MIRLRKIREKIGIALTKGDTSAGLGFVRSFRFGDVALNRIQFLTYSGFQPVMGLCYF